MDVQDRTAVRNVTGPLCGEAVLEQIRAAVSHGYLALGHGGLEVGGILLGKFAEGSLRIEESLPLTSEYATGPSLHLSAADEQALAQLLAQADPDLSGLEPVGWYRSYTRRELAVTADDIAVMDRFFPEPGMMLLLLKPVTRHRVTGSFFVRREGGSLNLEPVGEELELRLSLQADSHRAVGRSPGPAEKSRPRPVSAHPVEHSPADAESAIPRAPRAKRGRPLITAIAATALIGLGAMTVPAWQRFHPVAIAPPLPKPIPPPLAALQSPEAVELKNEIAELTLRNRRLEETISVLRSRSQPKPIQKHKKVAQRRRSRH